jgi:hypothetical protein
MVAFIGFALAVLGLGLVSIGVTGAAFKVFADQGQGFAGAEPGIVDILKLVPNLLSAIGKAPNWLGMTAAGVILIIVGIMIARRSVVKL